MASNIAPWRFWNIDERIYWLFKPFEDEKQRPKLESRHSIMTSIWDFLPEKSSSHPAPFPLVLPVRIIYSIFGDSSGKIILDPYSGSGTTLLAASLLGHSYVGIDISETYIEMAKERLKNKDKFMQVITEEKKLHVVKQTFKERKENGMWSVKTCETEQLNLLGDEF